MSNSNSSSMNNEKSKFPKSIAGSINAFHINAAREVHNLTMQSRIPNFKKNIDYTDNDKDNVGVDVDIDIGYPTQISVPAITEDHSNCKNPQCSHCGQVIIPSPESSLPLIDRPSISINNKWHIFTQRKPILNATEIETFENHLNIPVPEMIFGNNKVEIKFNLNGNEETLFHINFNGFDALKLIEKNNLDTLIKVSYANEWFKSRKFRNEINNKMNNNEKNIPMEVFKPFDWTYSTTYKGTVFAGDNLWVRDDSISIPTDKLKRKDPILFYDDMILYEDELGDNGISILNIKIRVMRTCLLILQRLFVRVDDVLVKINDTRLFIDFESNLIIREFKMQEQDYKSLLKICTGNDPRRLLRDISWCSSKLPIKKIEREYIDFNNSK